MSIPTAFVLLFRLSLILINEQMGHAQWFRHAKSPQILYNDLLRLLKTGQMAGRNEYRLDLVFGAVGNSNFLAPQQDRLAVPLGRVDRPVLS